LTPERLAHHWQTLHECEHSGARPATYRELVVALTQEMSANRIAQAYIEELEVRLRELESVNDGVA
jgi:hypothetical protein